MRRLAGVLAAVVLTAPEGVMAEPIRAMSLDQCADQYLLKLAPEADLFLSPRADDADSFMAREAEGRARVRPTLESAIAVRPQVVVRTWGGDPRMLAVMERRGAKIVSLPDASDMAGVEANLRTVARAMGEDARGEALVAEMQVKLARAAHSEGSGRTALYLTSGGYTAGAGTLIDAILKAAGFRNLAGDPGFAPVSVERMALQPPARVLLGFFDQVRADWRGVGRHPVVKRATRGRVAASLPAAVLTCPAWFAADAAVMLSEGHGLSVRGGA